MSSPLILLSDTAITVSPTTRPPTVPLAVISFLPDTDEIVNDRSVSDDDASLNSESPIPNGKLLILEEKVILVPSMLETCPNTIRCEVLVVELAVSSFDITRYHMFSFSTNSVEAICSVV